VYNFVEWHVVLLNDRARVTAYEFSLTRRSRFGRQPDRWQEDPMKIDAAAARLR
jgi:hypothetical protein